MKYPHRIKVKFNPEKSKLPIIQQINHFLNHDAKGKWERYNINQRVDGSIRFTGIELAFSDARDAVHFKLGYFNE